MGRERALALEPSTDLTRIQRPSSETRQGRRALGRGRTPSLGSDPGRAGHARAGAHRGRGASRARELVALIPAPRGRRAGWPATAAASRPWRPSWRQALARPPRGGPLRDLLRRSLDEDGAVRDEASSELRRLRGRLRELRRALIKRLEAFFQQPGADALFQERYVTVRHGRYVLPVLAGAKTRLRGIVHDRSQSGATLFVEPESVVEDNNDLVQAAREEEDARSSASWPRSPTRCARRCPSSSASSTGSARWTSSSPARELAERMDAVEPAVADERAVDVRGARHPLLLAQGWAQRGARRGPSCPGGSLPRRRASAARHHGAERGRQDGGAQDAGRSSR